MQLVIATSNLHKLREYKDMLKEVKNLDIYSLRDFPLYDPPEEKGKSFEEIAKLKAVHAANQLNKTVLADDSGLVVPILNDEPGLLSSRYAHKDASDEENRKKLITKLEQISEEKRTGFFVCSIALAIPGEVKKIATGLCEGHLLTTPRGHHGFGYDSLFLKYDYSKTFAELDEKTKNRISHRRKAIDKILPTLYHVAALSHDVLH